MACVEIEQVVAREVVVGCFGPCYSVGVRRAEKRAGEGFAGLGLDLHALDAQPLLALLRRAGAEDEADAHDLEFRGAERVDRHAVRERAAEGFVERYVRRSCELRLFQRVAR